MGDIPHIDDLFYFIITSPHRTRFRACTAACAVTIAYNGNVIALLLSHDPHFASLASDNFTHAIGSPR